MKSLKEFLFGKWVVKEACPMHMTTKHGGNTDGLLILWENLRTGKQYSRVEFLDGSKEDLSPELANSVIQRYREKYPK